MIGGTGKGYSQGASHAESFIKDLLCPSAEDGLDPYSSLVLYVKNEGLTPFLSLELSYIFGPIPA